MSVWVKRVLSVLLVSVLVGGAVPLGNITASAAFTTNPMISALDEHSLALRDDGTVWAWGSNRRGQLGDGTTNDRSSPVQVSSLSSITAVAAGGSHSLALRSDGTVWAWGNNIRGQLGIGLTWNDPYKPVQISGISNVVAIAAGSFHSVALRNDGTVWAWGENNHGQLGDGTTSNYSDSPVQVIDLSGVMAISVGEEHNIALKSDGTVWAWGGNYNDQLGDGTTINRNKPIQISQLNGTKAISAGYAYSLALKNDGTVWFWGSSPAPLSGLADVKAISAGFWIQKSDGFWRSVNNNPAQLTAELSSFAGVTSIVNGWNYMLVLRSDGTVWGWGDNSYGQLGNGTTTDQNTLVQVKGLNLGVGGGPDQMLITSASPASGTTGVSRDTTIELSFSQPIHARIDSGIKLRKKTNNQLIDVECVCYASNPNVLRITPKELLEANTEYYLTVDNNAIMAFNNEFFAGITGTQDYYFTTGGNEQVERIEVKYNNRLLSTITLNIPWSDSYFLSSTTYRSELAVIGLALVNAAYDGETRTKDTLSKLGFDNIKWNNRFIVDFDNVYHAIGSKRVMIDGKPCNIVAIVLRGTKGEEWVSTLHGQFFLGGGTTKDIQAAAKHAEEELYDYINNYIPKGEGIKIFITGHSRGAAVADILACSMTLDSTYGERNVFGYGFATLNTTDTQRNMPNIHNILNHDDVACIYPMRGNVEKSKYGVPISFSRTNNPEFYKKYLELVMHRRRGRT